MTDDHRRARGSATLLACWDAYARWSTGASVLRLPGVDAAVFPSEPERAVYNNALLHTAGGIEPMEAVFAAAGIERYAAWVHEDDPELAAVLGDRGYRIEETTRAMGLSLDDLDLARPELELEAPDWDVYLRTFGLPDGFLDGADAGLLHLRLAREAGEIVAASLAFDLDGDCGVYNVETVERARRRGLGPALTVLQLHEARARGDHTASLQASPMAERLYARVGFRDLGRFLEYVPAGEAPAPTR
jgi:ribosomal protein S18 acetylase RimI-like enzyme